MSTRALVLAVLTGAALLMTAPPDARAAQPAVIGSAADLAAAWQAAATGDMRAVLVRFFAQEPEAPGAPVSVDVLKDASPVYELSAAFVAGLAGASAGEFAYMAVPVRASDGRTATVWSVKDKDGWQVGNIASGDIETAFAKSVPAGGLLLHEPQIDAWYAVHAGRVTQLGVTSAKSMTLIEYQHAVAARYGDKLPGSPYAQQGEAGGFGTADRVMPRGDGGAAPDNQHPGMVPLLVTGGLLVVAGVAYALRLRRRTSVAARPARPRIESSLPAGPA